MNLKVNTGQWNALDKTEKARIEAIVGAYFKGATITTDAATPLVAVAANPFCTIA